MKTLHYLLIVVAIGSFFALALGSTLSDKEPALPRAFVDGVGPDWKQLGEKDFVNVKWRWS